MDDKAFQEIRELVYKEAGITLADSKKSLVTARLMKVKRKIGITDDLAYIKHVKNDASGEALIQLLDAISTNVTHFFRESEHFDFVSEAVTKWLEQGQDKIRFWSAASSTGEEPYSLGITIQRAADQVGRRPDVRILATDISTRVLAICKEGVYEKVKLDPIPKQDQLRFFEKTTVDGQPHFMAKPALKKMIQFSRLNLSAPPFPMRGPLDMVFCRNVMIYFDNETRSRLLGEIFRLLKPGGYLMVGHAESLTNELIGKFERVGPSIYLKAA